MTRSSIVGVLAAGTLATLWLASVSRKHETDTAALQIPANLISGETDPLIVADIFATYRDPATNLIPADTRQRELAYVRTLPHRSEIGKSGGSSPLFEWVEAGPHDIGGRTRTLVFDAANPNTIVTGGVIGGIWKTTDAGKTWVLKTTVNENPGVSALVQDPRPGRSNVWYYGAGEWRGDLTPSDRGYVALYNGVGIYKSEDNAESWTLLPASADPNLTGCCDAFDYVHRLVISPESGTLFVASNTDGIYRSADGGQSFTLVLGASQQHTWSEVAVGSNGTLVASLSSSPGNSLQAGVYRSTNDGLSWDRITPSSFPLSHRRSVIAVAPSSPDLAYIMTLVSTNRGDGREDIRFHTLNLVNGGGEDRTANLPNFQGNPSFGPSMRSIGDFTMAVSVKPDDPDFVVIGGVTVFRSRDGFATPLTDRADGHIGGYLDFNTGAVFPNHFVDNHLFVFNPSNDVEMWCANDNGISVMRDVTAPPVWESSDEGFNVTQFYGVGIADGVGDVRLAGGMQDYGMVVFGDLRGDAVKPHFTNSMRLYRGDAGYVYLGANKIYSTTNSGMLVRTSYVNDSVAFGAVPIPTPLRASGQRFINQFAVDPNDEQKMYYPAGAAVWRNENLEAPNPNTWTLGATAPSGYVFRAVATSRTPAHIVYLGANNFSGPPKVFRWERANVDTDVLEEISIPGAPVGAYIHDIAIHPQDADEVLVLMSNYNIIGLYHSTDGGGSYTAVEGNLHGGGVGPSLRSATIVPMADGSTAYVVGTSAGLFSTTTLNEMNTVWEQEDYEHLGNIIVEQVRSRPSDGRVIAGTHGRGIFLGTPENLIVRVDPPDRTASGFRLEQNYPNPFNASTSISFTVNAPARVDLTVFDVMGRQVGQLLSGELIQPPKRSVLFEAGHLASGIYVYRADVTMTDGRTYSVSRGMTLIR